MPDFQVVSPFQPQGDQPAAIDALTKGVREGKKFQTLMGITGSGKSLAWDEPVLVRRSMPGRGSYNMSVEPIGRVIDAAFDGPAAVTTEGDSAVVEPPEPVEALSFNPTTGRSEWRPVTALSRHAPAGPMYRVRTACGREVVVTGDHNFFTLRDGTIGLRETADLGPADYVPLPTVIDLPDVDLPRIDLFDLLRDADRVEVFAAEAFGWIVDRVGWPAVRDVLLPHDPVPSWKRHAVVRGRKWKRLPIAVFCELIGLLDRDGLSLPDEFPVHVRTVHGQPGSPVLPRMLPVTDDVLTVFGLMLAEGHCAAKGFATFTTYEADVRAAFERSADALGIPYGVRRSGDYQINSGLWRSIIQRTVGGRSREKRLPAFWPTLSRRQLGVLLRTYMEGDGGVDGPAVTAATASRGLASDLAYAFSTVGIWARLNHPTRRATNSPTHAGDVYHGVVVSGAADLRAYADAVGFLTDRKRSALAGIVGRPANTNVDVVPIGGRALVAMRTAAGLSHSTLAQACGYTRPAVAMLERDQRRPSRHRLSGLLAELDRHTETSDARRLLNARWTPVRSVEVVPYDRPFVYDFTVEANETFLAGHGGLFVHNTFSMAHTIARLNRPTLVISHNKTLAAQLYEEFKELFPHNAVGYFVSYYDYYQPEAYIPQRDIYIEKDASRNDDLDRLRLAATSSLVSRRDVLLVASVSCIFGLGSPSEYRNSVVPIRKGEPTDRDEMLRKLIDLQYARNDIDFKRATFRVRGDVVELHPSYEEFAYRIEFFGDEITDIDAINPLTGEVLKSEDEIFIYPAVHYVMPEDRVHEAVKNIKAELETAVMSLRSEGKLLEAQRLLARTKYDIEMMLEVGYCSGIENYSRHLDGRPPGAKPYTLIDYFDKDFLTVIDESHVTLPQIKAMYNGDRQRKEVLVGHGFRLPSAMDNRPLKFEEFEGLINQCIYVSATPGKIELEQCGGEVVEQVIRPTGLLDPVIEVVPAQGQVPHLLAQIKERVEGGGRVLVTTLTKRLSEDLSAYIQEAGFKGRYLHSEIQTIERVEILTDLRKGDFDVLIGINLLREGLDLPEVNLVCILDADKAGFLRSETSLIQTIGRAARNSGSKVILYADKITPAMKAAMDETDRRRTLQTIYNTEHGITPQTIQKSIRTSIESEVKARRTVAAAVKENEKQLDQTELIKLLEEEMIEAARNLEFERAAQLRDKLNEVKGAPTIATGGRLGTYDGEAHADERKIWEPKTKGRGGAAGKRRAAK